MSRMLPPSWTVALTGLKQPKPVNSGSSFSCNSFNKLMSNPYALQIAQQTGGSEKEAHENNRDLKRRTFPATIGGRFYETEEEYLSDLHDYLNEN